MQRGFAASSFAIAIALLVFACDGPGPLRLKTTGLSRRSTNQLPQGQRPESQRRFREAGVYLDGTPLAVLKAPELPPGLKPRVLWDDFPQYPLAEYLQHLGVDLGKIKEVHLYGGKRTAIIAGSELLKFKDKLMFAFNQATRGKPRMEWPGGGLKVNTTIDTIQAIAVYEAFAPPQLFSTKGRIYLAFEEGKPLDSLPYTPAEEPLKGTRIYEEGKLRGAVKRKTLPSAFQVPGTDAHPEFRLTEYLRSAGLDPTKMKAVDFLSGDDTIVRIDGGAKDWESLRFSMPRRSRGKIEVHFGERRGQVTAIVAYRVTEPPKREIHFIEAVDDAVENTPQEAARPVLRE